MDMSLNELRELVMDKEARHAAIHGVERGRHDWATELNWTELSCSEEVVAQVCPLPLENSQELCFMKSVHKILLALDIWKPLVVPVYDLMG